MGVNTNPFGFFFFGIGQHFFSLCQFQIKGHTHGGCCFGSWADIFNISRATIWNSRIFRFRWWIHWIWSTCYWRIDACIAPWIIKVVDAIMSTAYKIPEQHRQPYFGGLITLLILLTEPTNQPTHHTCDYWNNTRFLLSIKQREKHVALGGDLEHSWASFLARTNHAITHYDLNPFCV